MRENRTCGSEGGEAQSLPYPYPGSRCFLSTIRYSLSIIHYQFPLSCPSPWLPADYKSALPLSSAAKIGLFAQMSP